MQELLAQVAGVPAIEPMSWDKIASAAVSVGFAAAVAWYLLTKYIPNLTASHDLALQNVLSEFRNELKESRQFHREERERDRQAREADTGRIVDAIGEMRAQCEARGKLEGST